MTKPIVTQQAKIEQLGIQSENAPIYNERLKQAKHIANQLFWSGAGERYETLMSEIENSEPIEVCEIQKEIEKLIKDN